MATDIVVQELGANGAGTAPTFQALDATGMTFTNTGREQVIVRATGVATGVVTVEGVPAADSGRDGSEAYAPAVADALEMSPFYLPRNWNSGDKIELTITAPITNMDIAVVRVPNP